MQAARRLHKALHHLGIHADSALPEAIRPLGEFHRPRTLLALLPMRVWSMDEEKSEGKSIHIRMYGAKERSIKKRDGHHRRHNDDTLTLNKTGHQGILVVIKVLANNNTKPFSSNAFGEELADSHYLDTFGPETSEFLSSDYHGLLGLWRLFRFQGPF